MTNALPVQILQVELDGLQSGPVFFRQALEVTDKGCFQIGVGALRVQDLCRDLPHVAGVLLDGRQTFLQEQHCAVSRLSAVLRKQ